MLEVATVTGLGPVLGGVAYVSFGLHMLLPAPEEPGPLGPDELQVPGFAGCGPAVTEASDRWAGHTFDATSATTTEIAAPAKMSLG